MFEANKAAFYQPFTDTAEFLVACAIARDADAFLQFLLTQDMSRKAMDDVLKWAVSNGELSKGVLDAMAPLLSSPRPDAWRSNFSVEGLRAAFVSAVG
jgi:hypothetical protein